MGFLRATPFLTTFSIFLSLICSSIQAQVDGKFLTEIEYAIENNQGKEAQLINRPGLYENTSYSKFIKLDPLQITCKNRGLCFTEYLIKELKAGNKQAFSLSTGYKLGIDSIEFLISEQIINFDHFDTFYVENVKNIKSFEVQQKWQKSNKTARWSVMVQSIVPIWHNSDGTQRRLFSIVMPQSTDSDFSINKESIVWIKEGIDLIPISQFEQQGLDFRYFVELEEKFSSYDGASPFLSDTTLLRQEVNNILNSTDNKIVGLQLHQFWYLDLETGTFNTKINGIAPVVEVRDYQGSFRYYKGLFWVHFRR